MFKDIDIFIAAAQAIWNGQDPYHIAGVEAFYPLPFYFLFLPFAWLPLQVTHILWAGISCGQGFALLLCCTSAIDNLFRRGRVPWPTTRACADAMS